MTLPGALRARYHLQAGVDHIFLKSEDSPETSATLQQLGAQERAKVTSWAAGPGRGLAMAGRRTTTAPCR